MNPLVHATAASIPSVDRLINDPGVEEALRQHGRHQVTMVIRQVLADLRALAGRSELLVTATNIDQIVASVERRLKERVRSSLRAVFNLTGTVLHTNLGRAQLPACVMHSIVQAVTQPATLEFDPQRGERGERDLLLEPLLCELSGGEAATLVNNNAAAVLLMLHALANRREVVVSRGELVEIGGEFRIPDVMRAAGAKLIEVGTTNCTHANDYVQAIGPRTAVLMKVHASNYAITGFTANVELGELSAIGRTFRIPTVVDLGSGSLIDLAQWGLPSEPTVRGALKAGADLVTFSGDKLLGGPQAGIIVGRSDLIHRLRKHPLKRALRVGKLTLAALEAVLALYRQPEKLAERLTTLRLLTRRDTDIAQQSRRLVPLIQAALGDAFRVTAEPMWSQIGSGALPVDRLASYGAAIRGLIGRRSRIAVLAGALRATTRPVIGRIADNKLWLDFRCLETTDEPEFLRQWGEILL